MDIREQHRAGLGTEGDCGSLDLPKRSTSSSDVKFRLLERPSSCDFQFSSFTKVFVKVEAVDAVLCVPACVATV